MSRSKKGSKGPGFDYWGKRPFSVNGHGSSIKKLTHKKERAISKQKLHKLKKDV
jgi:hypothetical protein